jgi:ArsR family transcriptional regulator
MKVTEKKALDGFAAMSQETRLRIVRILVTAGPSGLPAGAIAEQVGASSSRMSFHLSHLEQAGLVRSRRDGRSIIYSVSFPALNGLIEFLTHNCCKGNANPHPFVH